MNFNPDLKIVQWDLDTNYPLLASIAKHGLILEFGSCEQNVVDIKEINKAIACVKHILT